MFGLRKAHNSYEQEAETVLRALLAHIRQPVFYTACGVPDTFEGRFDLLALHLFMVFHCVLAAGPAGKDFNQALFDAAFAGMDQALREGGIGDMGVPKRMRRMMTALNGRVHAYENALAQDETLKDALARNLYGPQADFGDTVRMAAYVRETLAGLSYADILNGIILLKEP
ncbi:MAG: ubiquinol-cytochrome C chaperone [Alphaproteobacteria bacterium]|nr:ubiquinol-cytochrome C chaperone [Alphaproteobacteria bacterium]